MSSALDPVDRGGQCRRMAEENTPQKDLSQLSFEDALRALDLSRLRGVMAGNGLVDLRNIYRPEVAEAAGFIYVSVGRGMAPEPEMLVEAAE